MGNYIDMWTNPPSERPDSGAHRMALLLQADYMRMRMPGRWGGWGKLAAFLTSLPFCLVCLCHRRQYPRQKRQTPWLTAAILAVSIVKPSLLSVPYKPRMASWHFAARVTDPTYGFCELNTDHQFIIQRWLKHNPGRLPAKRSRLLSSRIWYPRCYSAWFWHVWIGSNWSERPSND